jgi:hypothetical protein
MLERQLLLRRHDRAPAEVIEHLVGLQAQEPKDPYTALWTRLVDFDPQSLARLLTERRAVRMTLMRGTIHLVTAADAYRLRPHMAPVITRVARSGVYGRPLAGVDLDEVATEAARLAREQPRTSKELGRLLAERWPDRDPAALGMAGRTLVPMVQITPRGVWACTLRATWATLDAWLDATVPPPPLSIDDLVLRYLAGFGPALVPDMQAWSGQTRLAEVFDRLRPQLRTFRDEQGRELFDLPDAPRPGPDVPAPVRFLPEYDNLGLGLGDRSRLVLAQRPLPTLVRSGVGWGSVLVDGCFQGMWKIEHDDEGATLVIAPSERYGAAERDELIREGLRLLELHAGTTDPQHRDVRIAALN